MKRERLETVEEFLKRGGKITQLPDEQEWVMFPPEEKLIFKSCVETLDYERDHKSRRD